MTVIKTNTIAASTAVAILSAFGTLATPDAAEAGSLHFCAGSSAASVCLGPDGVHVNHQQKADTHYQLAQNNQFLVGGGYFGTWKDGTNMVERINFANGYIPMQRMTGGHGNNKRSPVVTFARTGSNAYTNSHGSKIEILSPTPFVWRNSNNANHVVYQKMN